MTLDTDDRCNVLDLCGVTPTESERASGCPEGSVDLGNSEQASHVLQCVADMFTMLSAGHRRQLQRPRDGELTITTLVIAGTFCQSRDQNTA